MIKDYRERDLEGYVFAVRLPGVPEGRLVETPVRIDNLYCRLLESDFRSLDLETLKSRADSPYSDQVRRNRD